MCLNTDLPVTTLARGGRGTRHQVWLACKESNSRYIATCQFGSLRAVRTELGIGESSVEDAVIAYRGLGL